MTYVISFVPIGLAGSLLLAVLLNQSVHGNTIFRTLFFLPTLTPVVAATLLWKWLPAQPDVGLVNNLLWGVLRVQGPVGCPTPAGPFLLWCLLACGGAWEAGGCLFF